MLDINYIFDNFRYIHTTSMDYPDAQQIIDAKAKKIVRQINRIISNNVTEKASHIISTQVLFLFFFLPACLYEESHQCGTARQIYKA